jgi:hypothetical protein
MSLCHGFDLHHAMNFHHIYMQAGRHTHSHINAAFAAGHQDKPQLVMPHSMVPDVLRCQKELCHDGRAAIHDDETTKP